MELVLDSMDFPHEPIRTMFWEYFDDIIRSAEYLQR